MGKFIDMTGQHVGMLTVIREMESDKRGNKQWECKCDCGKIIRVVGNKLRNKQQSCGCLRLIRSITHNASCTPEYKIWKLMKNRCVNLDPFIFKSYKGCGIKVCDRWLNSFENFLKDMGKRPEKTDEIDRIDNNGNYCPENCRWTTHLVNSRNTRRCRWWYINGIKYESSTHASEELEVSRTTIRAWCNGYYTKAHNFYPPKDNCWSELKYNEEGISL